MADIFKNWYSKLEKQTRNYPMGVKIIIFAYCSALVFLFITILALNIAGVIRGEGLDNMIKLFDRLTSPQMLAAVICAGKFFVDIDGNGIADSLEEKGRKHDS